MNFYDVAIIGGGLAGLTSGIHLSRLGFRVVIIEKHEFPRHKVCGEYISNEVLPYLKWLDLDIEALKPSHISTLRFTTANGRMYESQLPGGGFGISRFAFDHFLFENAAQSGCDFVFASVTDVSFLNDIFTVTTNDGHHITAKIALGAFGKRSNLDKLLQRQFALKKSNWLAIKAHYDVDFPDDVVGLYNFAGGYCGVSQVEDGKVNICYLTDYKSFAGFKDATAFQSSILSQNPELAKIFSSARMIFDRPMTISQISFDSKPQVENHILMIGDSAGLIHPLCGNGMAMAILAAKMASEAATEFLLSRMSRLECEASYSRKWKKQFSSRMRTGRILAFAMRNRSLTDTFLKVLKVFPSLLPAIIAQTHGKPIVVSS